MKNLSVMKNIEDIIKDNKGFFDEAEPMDGHFERFSTKLERRFSVKTIKRSIVPQSRIVAMSFCEPRS